MSHNPFESLPPDLARIVGDGAAVQQQPMLLREERFLVARYAVGIESGMVTVSFDVPVAGGMKRLTFPFDPQSIQKFIDRLNDIATNPE